MGPIRAMLLPGALAFATRHPVDRPVLFVLGGLSNPDHFGESASRLSKVFPDFRLEVFDGRHHFDPPHRIEPERLAGLLRGHWDRAESRDHAEIR